MKGLLKNNYYAALANAKVMAVIMILLGALGIALKNQGLLIAFTLLCMIGFSFISIASIRREGGSKWGKYKLTTPVKRGDIVWSHFLSLLLWLALGMLMAGMGITLSLMFRGFLFDKNTDIFNLYIMGMGISLFMGAVFFLLFYRWGGQEQSEAFLAVSLIGGGGIMLGISMLVNTFFPTPVTPLQTVIIGMMILAIAVLMFGMSCILSVYFYGRHDY